MSEVLCDIDVSDLIPHRGRMHLMDAIDWVDCSPVAIRGRTRTRLRAEAPYFSPNGFARHWLLELCAQASAALFQAARGGSNTKSRKGYLIHIREFSTPCELTLKPGDEIVFNIAFEIESEFLGQSRCQVTARGEVVGAGELTFLLDS